MALDFAGPHTEVLVLGVPHLDSSTPDSALRPTLQRLLAWRPDVVAVELLPGEVVDSYLREGGAYDSLQVGGFATARRLGDLARPHRPWSRHEAEERALGPDTTPTERVLAWMIALEPFNALLAWTPDLDPPREVTAALQELAAWPGEVTRLAVPLARQLSLTRLVHFDDFTRFDFMVRAHDAYVAAVSEAELQQLVDQHPAIVKARTAKQAARQANDLWPLLLSGNSPHSMRDTADLESGLFLRTPVPGGAHRMRLGLWDARNLFMAARLRLATAACPGGRVLAIVGASHKGPLEAALGALGADLRFVPLSGLEA